MLKTTPLKHQIRAEKLFKNLRQLALFMEAGTGKTLTALMLCLQKLKRKSKILIICPKNLISSWEDEIEKHLKDGLKTFDFTIKNYEHIRAKIHDYLEEWDFIILDECHRIKNRRSKTAKALWKLKAKYRLILSGTSVAKDEIDLWSQFKFLNPNIWGSNFSEFADQALDIKDWGEYQTYVPNKKKIRSFINRAKKFIYRVTLDEIVDLPGQLNVPVYFNLRGPQKKHYYELQDDFITEYQGKRASIDLSATSLIRLHQLVGGHLTLETRDIVRFKEQPKLWWILDKLEDIGNQKLIIFCRYTLEIELIAEALRLKGYKFAIMQGGMKDKEIKSIRKAFQTDKTLQILIGQIQCVKEGNNFQDMCRYGVFYSKSLSSVDLDQCKGRLYRKGQTKKVIYWHLIMKDTIDEDYETIVKEKHANAESILIQLMRKRKCLKK